MFVLRLSASGRGVHRVYLNQAQQAFLDGHVRAFERLGGVPARERPENAARHIFRGSVPARDVATRDLAPVAPGVNGRRCGFGGT